MVTDMPLDVGNTEDRLRARVEELERDFCSIEELNRARNERDHALDDLKAEIANHRKDNDRYRRQKGFKVMEYLCIHAQDVNDLNDRVNRAIGRGFEPLGGIAVAYYNGISKYVQAMIKK